MIGKAPLGGETIFQQLFHRFSYPRQQGSEFRAISAIDAALGAICATRQWAGIISIQRRKTDEHHKGVCAWETQGSVK
ncbi:MAG: hypothetical protein KAR36_10315 [Candidatus Latescibacteria bacterium]|nr:hypothetical protein [Candidatus Latescibacterota bacterium]